MGSHVPLWASKRQNEKHLVYIAVPSVPVVLESWLRTGKRIQTTEVDDKDYYTQIIYLSEGATHWTENKQGEQQRMAFRVVILTSEIYNRIILEKVSYGPEGGDKKIASRREVDLDSFWAAFGLKGEIAGVQFLNWVNWDAFKIGIGGRTYLIKDIALPTVKAARTNQ
jgi:hypothetical protein